ncbi:MAG: hypothetical protein ACLFM7_03485 [Bacteroidales bacterium]
MVKYKYEHIDMLLAAAIAVQSFKKYVNELSYIRSYWTPDFAEFFADRIENAMKNHLGVEYPDDLRKSNERIMEIRPTTRRDLAFIKWQIEMNFSKEEADAILNYLGYDRYFAHVISHDQQSLVNLLFFFKSGMNYGLRRLITGQGTNPPLIDRVIEYAGIFQRANQIQKQLREKARQPSGKAHREFQEIYKEVILICKTGAVFFQEEPEKREGFVFSGIVQSLYAGISTQKGEHPREK